MKNRCSFKTEGAKFKEAGLTQGPTAPGGITEGKCFKPILKNKCYAYTLAHINTIYQMDVNNNVPVH